MTTYDFLSAEQAILSNVRTNFNLTQFFAFGQLLTWIGTNNDPIWIPKVQLYLSGMAPNLRESYLID